MPHGDQEKNEEEEEVTDSSDSSSRDEDEDCLRTVAPAPLPQVTLLTQIPTEFCGTENFAANVQGIHVKWKGSFPCPF